jgi:AcrR family transcriptional regulator
MNAVEIKADTKQRILDSAERLFAERGFDGISLRAIIADAKVNLAAIHYHYHSKEALLEAVILRRVEPINRERLRLLNDSERASGGGRPSLEAVLEAFLAPPFRAGAQPEATIFLRLMGRIMGDAASFRNIFERHFRVILERFSRALQSAAPELSPVEILWRLNFVGGGMAHVMRFWGQDTSAPWGPIWDSSDVEGAVNKLVSFAAAGFRAPVTEVSRHV